MEQTWLLPLMIRLLIKLTKLSWKPKRYCIMKTYSLSAADAKVLIPHPQINIFYSLVSIELFIIEYGN